MLKGFLLWSCQVYTGPLKDPLLAQERERNREDQVILRCSTGNVYSLSDIEQIKLPTMPLVPLGRHGTNSMTWLEMPLGNIESTPRKASRYVYRTGCGCSSPVKIGHCGVERTSIVLSKCSRLVFISHRMFVDWLVAYCPSNMLVYLRDGSAWTILRAATLK